MAPRNTIDIPQTFIFGGAAPETTLKHDVCICVTQGIDVYRYRTQQVIAIGLYEMEEDDKKVSINLIILFK